MSYKIRTITNFETTDGMRFENLESAEHNQLTIDGKITIVSAFNLIHENPELLKEYSEMKISSKERS